MSAARQLQRLSSLRLLSRAGKRRKSGTPAPVQPWRLPLLAIFISVLTLTSVGITVYFSVRQSITDQANEHLAAVAMLKVGQIEHWLGERRDDAQQVARSSTFSSSLQRWLANGRRDERLKENLLRNLQEISAVHHYRAVGIYAASDGEQLLTTGGEHSDEQRDREQARKAVILQAPLLDDLHFSPDAKPSEIELGYFIPIVTGNSSSPVAVAYLVADPTKLLFPLLQKLPSASPSAETLLVRVEGNHLIYLNTLRHQQNRALQFRMPLSTPELLAAQAAQGKTGAISGVDYRNIRSLGYALPVAGTPWLLIAKIDEAEIYAHFNKMALFSAIVTALSLFSGIWWVVEHAKSAARIERLSRLYAAISQTNQAIIHSHSPAEVYRAVCTACVELAGLRLAWVGIADPELRRIVPVEAAGDALAYLDNIVISTQPDIPEGRGPISFAYREQRVHECADFLSDPATLPWQERAAEFGLACAVALPLQRAGKSIGILCVYGGEKNFFDGEALKILGEMANNISFFLDHFDQETQRRQLAQELATKLAEIEDLYQNAPCGYHSLNADGLIVRINDTELHWLGYTRDEVVNRLHASQLLNEESRRAFQTNFTQFKTSGELKDLQLEMVRKDGSTLPVNLTASVVTDQKGNYLYSRTTVFDMTDIRRLEMERSAQASHLQLLSRRLVAVQEKERRVLVGELHDSTSPNLATIQVMLNTIKPLLAAHPDINTTLEDVQALLDDTSQSIREICSDLRPPLLDYAGLAPALGGYAQQFGRHTGITVHFDARNITSRFLPEIESSLFRIVQEALTNCAKHAKASAIDIDMSQRENLVLLVIADNGAGFSPESLGKPGYPAGHGLITMRERAEFIGGTFDIASQPGKGTRIIVKLAMATDSDVQSNLPSILTT